MERAGFLGRRVCLSLLQALPLPPRAQANNHRPAPLLASLPGWLAQALECAGVRIASHSRARLREAHAAARLSAAQLPAFAEQQMAGGSQLSFFDGGCAAAASLPEKLFPEGKEPVEMALGFEKA